MFHLLHHKIDTMERYLLRIKFFWCCLWTMLHLVLQKFCFPSPFRLRFSVQISLPLSNQKSLPHVWLLTLLSSWKLLMFPALSFDFNMGQSIQEWTKYILWKTAFKKFQGIWSYLNHSRILRLIYCSYD